MRKTLLALGALTAVSLPVQARAHELQGYVSPAGMEVLGRAIPTLVPERLEGLEFKKELDICPGDPVVFTQSKTNVELEIHNLDIEARDNDHLRVDVTLSVRGDGEIQMDNIYACFSEETCGDDFFLNNARAVLDFNIEIEGGKPVLTVYDIDLQVAPEDLDFNLADCGAIDNIGNWAVDAIREYLLDYAIDFVEGMAREQLSPMLADMMVGFNGAQVEVMAFGIDAQLAETNITAIDGLQVVGDIDIYSRFSPSTCIKKDPGEPKSHPGESPFLDVRDAHVGVAANYGLVEDALYHAWRRGMMCVSDKTLEGFGMDTSLMMEEIGKMMPGFPVDTKFSVEVRAAAPPRLEGSNFDNGAMRLVVEGLSVEVIGRKADGQAGSLKVELDMSIEAKLGVDPTRNVMTVQLGEATLDRLTVEDQIEKSKAGFDAARIRHVIGDFIMPAMMEEMSGMPLMAPIVGYQGVYVILDETKFDDAFLSAKLDLFVAPENDDVAPETRITDKPDGAANPKTAVLAFTGSDDQIPEQLMQFVVTIDGVAAEPSFVKEAHIGAIGETKTYRVEVAAMDLNGNVDPSPESVEVFVDGIAPGLVIRGSRIREVEDEATFEWSASDDITAESALRPTIEVYRLNDKTDILSKQLVASQELPAGTSKTTIPVKDGDLYRVEVIVKDEAGNESRSSLTLRTPGYGGCAATGAAGSVPFALALGLVAFVLRRRRVKVTH